MTTITTVVVKQFFSSEVLECRSSDGKGSTHQAVSVECISAIFVLTVQDTILNFEVDQVDRICSLNNRVIRSIRVLIFHSEPFDYKIHDLVRLNQNTPIDDGSIFIGT